MTQLPPILQPYADRKVRVVAGYGELEFIALMELWHPTKHYTTKDMAEIFNELDNCELSIADWTAKRQESTVDPCS